MKLVEMGEPGRRCDLSADDAGRSNKRLTQRSIVQSDSQFSEAPRPACHRMETA